MGLVSRLASPSGGVGGDAQGYTDFTRAVYDAAPPGFGLAVAELQARPGGAGGAFARKHVLLALWMARTGAGAVPPRAVVDSARRLRVS